MTDTPANSKDVIVAISSFKSKTIRIKVSDSLSTYLWIEQDSIDF